MLKGYECVDDQMAAVFRAMTPGERLAVADQLWHFAHDSIKFIVGNEHPDWSGEQVTKEVARRMSHGAV
jgi:hypothetical protein